MIKPCSKKWTAALYARISRDDNSNEYSIENQKKRLYYFVDTHGEEFQSAELYVDIGASGSNSDREHFSRLLRDIKTKKVNCVIVKDLSRLSRNYYEAGYYLDYFFSSLRAALYPVNLIQKRKCVNIIFAGISMFFDLNREKHTVMSDQQIDFPCIPIPVKIERQVSILR